MRLWHVVILRWSWCAFDMRLMCFLHLALVHLCPSWSCASCASVVLLWQSLRVRLCWGGEASLGAEGASWSAWCVPKSAPQCSVQLLQVLTFSLAKEFHSKVWCGKRFAQHHRSLLTKFERACARFFGGCYLELRFQTSEALSCWIQRCYMCLYYTILNGIRSYYLIYSVYSIYSGMLKSCLKFGNHRK